MKFNYFLILLPLLFTSHTEAKTYFYENPRLMAGADMGYYRITLKEFPQVYDGRWGKSPGAFLGVRAYKSYYLTVKYGEFNKKGLTEATASDMTDESLNAEWLEKWYKIGIRLHPPLTTSFNSYYGFGAAFYKIKETANTSVFQSNGPHRLSNENNDGNGSGIYMELGIEYFPVSYLAAWIELELSSAGMGGNPGFEDMSIGGFRFSTGLSIWAF